jgi:hypothetical protein
VNEIEQDVELRPRRQADLEIRRSDEYARSVFEPVPFGAFLQLDPTGRDGAGVGRDCRALGLNRVRVPR